MANLNSSKKNIRKSRRRGKRRQRVLEELKKLTRSASGLTPRIQKLIDKAAKETVVHKNRAAKLKSKLVKRSTNSSKD